MTASWLNPGRWVLYAVLVLALVLGVRVLDQSRQAIGYKRAQAEYAAQAKQADDKRHAVAAPIAAKEAAVQVQIRTVTKTLIQKVPVYVPSTSCPLPGGFRLLHDAAATDGVLPDPAGLLDAGAVPAQDAAALVIENYGIARSNAARLVGLQAWVAAQGALK